MKTKDVVIEKVSKKKLFIAILLLFMLIASYLVRFTTMIKLYEVNVISTIVIKNTFNISLIAVILIVLYVVENKRLERKLQTGVEMNEQ